MTSQPPTAAPDLTPCCLCGALTPVETICRVADPGRTLCPACRRTHRALLMAARDNFIDQATAAVKDAA